jgi:hypothetical protein
MPRRFLVSFNGTGFSVPVEGGPPLSGFYTVRRVLAENDEDAAQRALAALQKEERYRGMEEVTVQQTGSRETCAVHIEDLQPLSWWRWHFTKSPASFIFYREDENED